MNLRPLVFHSGRQRKMALNLKAPGEFSSLRICKPIQKKKDRLLRYEQLQVEKREEKKQARNLKTLHSALCIKNRSLSNGRGRSKFGRCKGEIWIYELETQSVAGDRFFFLLEALSWSSRVPGQ
jgi:hypothetical protein